MYKQPNGRLFAGLALFFVLSVASAEAPPTAVGPTTGISLRDCFQKARQISETLGISEEGIRLTQAQYRSAIGNILPNLSWIKTQEFQDTQNTGASGSNSNNSSLRSPIPESYFHLRQPIFAGGRDWQEIRILKSVQAQARFGHEQEDLQLLLDVASAFYNALSWNDQLEVLMQSKKLTQDRIDELKHFVNIGRSRESEILSAETQLATLEAQIENTRSARYDSRQLLLFLTGVPVTTPLVDDRSFGTTLTIDEALSRAGKRPEIMSAVEGVNQADLQIRYAKGAHLPIASFLGNYYTERVGYLTDVRWDATFLLQVPIYEGGTPSADVRAARSQEIIAQLTLARLKRDVDRQVRTAYEDLNHSLLQVKAYTKAVELSQKNYEVQKKEYRAGLINNLEVLQLLTDLQNVRRLSVASNAFAKLNDIQFRTSMGEGL